MEKIYNVKLDAQKENQYPLSCFCVYSNRTVYAKEEAKRTFFDPIVQAYTYARDQSSRLISKTFDKQLVK